MHKKPGDGGGGGCGGAVCVWGVGGKVVGGVGLIFVFKTFQTMLLLKNPTIRMLLSPSDL